uniref:T9SS type A sorting domain-containing protein n=1 Tax=candidate division WOR-3 bacterium TaxID=2052148 RepID=A0A7C4GE03_UNCW3
MKRCALLVTFVFRVTAAYHPWSCFHGDAQHTGSSSSVVGAPLMRIAAFNVGAQISGSPVVRDDGRVLVGARDVRLYCLDANLTSVVWVVDLSPFGSNIYFSAPALDDSGNAYITTNRRLVKVGRDGAIRWSWPQHNLLSISHSPVVGLDGKVYFACYSDSLYALNPDSTLAWGRNVGNDVNSAPAVGPDGRIYVATARGSGGWKLWCFNPDGSSPWAAELAGDADFASPMVGPDTVVYVGANRYLYAINPDGTVRWRDSLMARIQSCPALANESTLYVVAGARLYNVSTDSGVRWRRSIGGANYCSPAVDSHGLVYVGSANSSGSAFYVIASDSSVLDMHAASGEFWSSPAIAGRHVYIGNMNDTLYLFAGPNPGQAEQPVGGGSGFRIAPNPSRGMVEFDGAADATVSIYSVAGRVVFWGRVMDRYVDLRSLRSGVYIVEVRTQAGCERVRLVMAGRAGQ